MKKILLFLLSVFPVFGQNIKQLPPPEWTKNLTIYEVNLRQYSKEGTLASFRKELPRLKEMGVGILWFMPINPIGEKNRKGSLGSYYAVQDYFKFSPEFGTADEFKALVKEIHSMGMYAIIDWVANHTAWDNPWQTTHPEFYTKDDKGNFVPPVADWMDVIDLNYDNAGLRAEMTKALKFWVDEFKIDGFRCDVAGMVPQSFWQEAIPSVNAGRPLFWLAEWEEPVVHDKAFHMSYGWSFHGAFHGIAQGKVSPAKLDTLLREHKLNYPAESYTMMFTTNHDENSWNGTEYEKFGEGALTFAALSYVLPGMPLIYSGQESANKKRLKFFDSDPLDWGNYSLASFYTTLNELKRNNSALFNGSFGGSTTVLQHSNKNVFCVSRINGKKQVVGIFNLSNKKQEINISSSELKGKMVNVFTKEITEFSGVLQAELKPWEYLVFEK